jgi:hypothetical protein
MLAPLTDIPVRNNDSAAGVRLPKQKKIDGASTVLAFLTHPSPLPLLLPRNFLLSLDALPIPSLP